MILEGELRSLVSILPLSKEENKLQNVVKSVKMHVNLMFEKFNHIPCAWAIPDAWQ